MAAAAAGDAAPPRIKAIFSDLDGTIVHFPAWFEQHGTKIVSRDLEAKRAVVESPSGETRECRLLPSSTMGDGFVSERTIELVAALRAEGIAFVIVTAARKSTLFERQPMLPACDAACCETGSRVYLGTDDGLDGLDLEWAARFEHITGPLERELDVSERPEPLWQFFRTLRSEVVGLKCDSRSYYGCFRVDTKDDPAVDAKLREVIAANLPDGTCIGRADKQTAASPGSCTQPPPLGDWRQKPATSKTCAAVNKGAVAAPTAGLHFTDRLMAASRFFWFSSVMVSRSESFQDCW